ncbi:S-adenosyl-L-methionine-dependent methyltransferase [Apodospora peruviana]|uniref:tRNA (guanine(26)-N(2))-dimethyltransferase n=1 Tax=Apodospora peruviana TaxID=516989 RepID=A0AAE0M536_9PEZI|nr:S-adenosyl-L-methionine-dependent methyltransferase [Apodospora peruviana]
METEAKPPTVPPAEKQLIEIGGKRFTTVKEGLAYILVPEPSEEEKKKFKDGQGVQQVFYNPIQQFNRDLTILALKAYGKEVVETKQAANQSLHSKFVERKRKRKDSNYSERKAKLASANSSPAAKELNTLPGTDLQAEANSETAPEIHQPATTSTGQEAETPVENGAEAPDRPKYPNEHEKKPPSFTILDALSASGLRALRYANEIPFVTSVTSNDLTKSAVETIRMNVMHNKLEDKIDISHDDALAHMYGVVVKELRYRAMHPGNPTKSDKYDVVDLDPYGTAAPFLDAAVQAVRDDGGLLCVTCTDSGVWASNGYPEKCYSLYGGVPLKGWYSHEVGLRLILHAIETAAAKYGLAMEPLLSLSIDYYLRVFVKIRKSPARVKFQGGKNMITYNCDQGCGAWVTQPLMKNKPTPNKKGDGTFYKHGFIAGPTAGMACEHCGSTMHLAGPMYGGRIHSPAFIKSVLAEAAEASTEVYGTVERIRGMLQTALEEHMLSPKEMEAEKAKAEEAENGSDKAPKKRKTGPSEAELAAIEPYPFYFHPSQLAGTMHCAAPPERPLKGALRGLGYRVTRSHTKPGSMKTDAPWSVIWHVMREWVRQKAPVKEANIKVGSVAYRLLRLGEKEDAPEDTKPKEADSKQKEMAEVVFDEKLGRDSDTTKYVRYQVNPKENWGPMSRAKGH